MPDGAEHLNAFSSSTLTSAEKNNAQIDKEALALVYDVSQESVWGQFTLVTVHKPLTMILGPKQGIPTLAAAQLQR